MTNPYESPNLPPDFEPREPATIFRLFLGVGAFAAGFLVTMVLCLVISATAFGILGSVPSQIPHMLDWIVIFLCSPATVGPILSIVFWLVLRHKSRPFAVGAIAFGVSAFLLMGGCLLILAT